MWEHPAVPVATAFSAHARGRTYYNLPGGALLPPSINAKNYTGTKLREGNRTAVARPEIACIMITYLTEKHLQSTVS